MGPGLNCVLQISTASFRSLDLSRHCRASTASSRSQQLRALDLSGSRSQWARTSTACCRSQPRASDLSGRCRTSTTSSRSHWALPDLNCELQISAAASARSQWALPASTPELQILVALDLNGYCRTSTASSRSCWLQILMGIAGPQYRDLDFNGYCRTSTASSRSQWHYQALTASRLIEIWSLQLRSDIPIWWKININNN